MDSGMDPTRIIRKHGISHRHLNAKLKNVAFASEFLESLKITSVEYHEQSGPL